MARETALETPPERLIEWLRGCETVGCVRVEARLMVAGNESGTVAATFEIAEREDGGERFDAPAIYQRLVEDAEVVGGVQRYRLFAFRDGSKSPRDTHAIRIDGGANGDASESEPANAHGLVAQAHRHNEVLLASAIRGMGQAMNTLVEQNKALLRQVEKADERRVEMWNVLEDVARHDKEKESARHALKMKEQQGEVLRDGIKLLLPGLLTKLGMGSAAAQEEGIVRFVESLTEAQQAQVFGILTPEQQVALGGLLDARIKKEAQAAKEKSQ